ncbi:MAG: (d)CMP kinase [Spirochaetota bacterium]
MGASIIAISGKSGCGNTTVSKMVAERLGLRFINYTFRALAQERGLSLAQILALAEEDPAWDRLLDARQVELARMQDCVIGSRLAIWMLPEAGLKVYLKASQGARVARIHTREGGDPVQIGRFTLERDAKDHKRYLDTYGIDNDDVSLAHLVIDTERWDARQIARIICDAYEGRR